MANNDRIQPDLKGQEARPSDAEAAHAPNEGGAVRPPSPPTPDQRDTRAGENRSGNSGA